MTDFLAQDPMRLTFASEPPKATPPSLKWTLIISFFFGVFGVIPALRHRKRAIRMGRADIANRYVIAWLAVWAATWVVCTFVI